MQIMGNVNSSLLRHSGFPGGSDGKASACSARDPGSIPGLGRFPGEGNGYRLQYSCLENSMDREASGLQSMGSQRVRHNWATNTSTKKILQKYAYKPITHLVIFLFVVSFSYKFLAKISFIYMQAFACMSVSMTVNISRGKSVHDLVPLFHLPGWERCFLTTITGWERKRSTLHI